MSISVCIATYNGEKYLHEQIDSILRQLGEDDEIVISDDSSTDKTIEIIESFHDKRIVLLQKQTFHSHVYNFENALKHAKGDTIFLADQDDIWLPHKVSHMLALLQKCDLVLSDAKMVNALKEPICDSFFTFHHSKRGFFKNLYQNSYLGCCMAFNRKLLEIALPFPKYINMHDWWIGMNAELYSSIIFTHEPLVLYRRHEEALTPVDKQSSNTFLQKIGFRLAMLRGLGLRYIRYLLTGDKR
jgi:glycosyltransferase involved in cell wall biosynthesis